MNETPGTSGEKMARTSGGDRVTDSFAAIGIQRSTLGGVTVREDDIEPMKGIRFIAYLFRGMAILLILLMMIQLFSGLTGTVAASPGVLFAEAVRLIIFAGLLWGVGDLAVLWVKSHYDIRAARILLARVEYILRKEAEAAGTIKPASDTSRDDRAT